MPEAILLNSNDNGYGVWLLDDKSIRYFEENLSTIDNKLNQACITGQLIMMMKQVIYPATRLPILLTQMMNESNQNIINALYMALIQASKDFLPPENVQIFNKQVCDFFLEKAVKEKEDNKL